MIPKPSDKENIWEELNISYNWNQLLKSAATALNSVQLL